jgi:hypothetical protein
MKTHAAALLIVSIELAGCEALKPRPVSPPNVELTYAPSDKFFEGIANRVNKKFGGDKMADFIVIPSQGVWPIGTVLHPGTTFPADATACVADEKQIASAETPIIFPDYSSTFKNSLELGIDNQLIKRLVESGVKIKDKDEVTMTVADSKLEFIDDTGYTKLAEREACKSILSGRQLWMVRGYIVGKRTFSFSSEVERTGKAKIEKIASFDVDFGSGNSSIKVTDANPTKFVQIISAITIQQGSAKTSVPSAPQGAGRIFVQKDRQDSSSAGQAVVASLRAVGFNVESVVQPIDSSKMPLGVAELRFFNEVDRELALKVAAKLKDQFQEISLKRSYSPAQVGQLEVWLPRAGSEGK